MQYTSIFVMQVITIIGLISIGSTAHAQDFNVPSAWRVESSRLDIGRMSTDAVFAETDKFTFKG